MLRKNPKFDIKLKYRKIFEISIVLSLFLIIVAFKAFPEIKSEIESQLEPQETLKVIDIPQTGALPVPPPPPAPPVPIEAPDDIEDLIDVIIDETDLDPNAKPLPVQPPIVKEDDENENTIFFAVEKMPEPIGGIAGIQKKIVYPELARKAGVQGRVIVRAFIDKKGNVFDAEIIEGIGIGCDKEAIAAVMKTKFKPGMQRGKPVKVQISIPIFFKLN
jgi:protein TonB